MDLNRSGKPELLNARDDNSLGFSSWLSLSDGFELWDASPASGSAALIGHDAVPGHDSILSEVAFGSGSTSILGSQSGWGEVSVTGDFDGNGFVDLLALEPTYTTTTVTTGSGEYDRTELTAWDVVLQLSERDESHGAIRSVKNPYGGLTQLTWASSARLGDNENLHYTREVLASLQTGDQDPIDLRYFKGEHALGRFRGFGLVEVTSSGATTEYGYATSPLLEGAQVSQAIYRSDGTLEAAQINLYGPGGSWPAVYWDNLAPYTNPLVRECRYELGHGATQSDGTRTQTVTMEDLWSECIDLGGLATLSFEEWVAGMGWFAEPNSGDPSSVIADGVWGRLDDDLAELTGTGIPDSSGGTAPLIGIPGGPMDGGHLFPDELGTPSTAHLPSGTSLATGPAFVGESFPEASGSTEVWETTRDFTYIDDYDGDGVQDRLLESVNDYGVTLGPVTWLLSADDTYTFLEYQTSRNTAAWGFQLLRRLQSNGTTNYQDTRIAYAPYYGMYGAPVQTLECGDDPSCATGIQTDFTYSGGSLSGELSRVDYDDGSYTTRSLESAGPCTGRVVATQDQEGRQRTISLDSKCRPQSQVFEGVESASVYDAFGRVIQQSALVPQVDGSISTLGSWYEFTPRSVRAYRPLDGGGYRLEESFLDTSGRTVRGNICGVTSSSGQVCPVGGDTVTFRQTYGTDGREFASYGPYDEGSGEIPATYNEWSANGHFVAWHSSEHAEITTAWRTTQLEHHPGLTISWDPLGIRREVKADPMNTKTYVDGVFRGEVRRNAAGRTIETTTPEGSSVGFLYNDFGLLEEVFSKSTETNYARGSSTASTDTHRVQYEYDSMGRVTRELGADGTSMYWEYDYLGRRVLESFDDGGAILDLREWVYYPWDAAISATKVVERDLETNASIELLLDGAGRVQQTTDLTGTDSLVYGVTGSPVAAQDVNGVVRTFSYDTQGRLSDLRNASWAGGVSQSMEYNARGQVVTLQDADGVTVQTEYSVSGVPLRRYSPNDVGGRTLLWEGEYTAIGQFESVFANGVLTSFDYDTQGRTIKQYFGSSSEYTRSLTFTLDDRIETEVWSPIHSGSGETSYTYDSWGRLVSTTNPEGGVDDYYYDVAGQLRFHQDPVGATSEWDYSARGALEFYKPSTGGLRTSSRSVTAGGERVTHEQNAMGDMVSEFRDGAGRVTRKEFPDGTTLGFVYSGSQLSEEQLFDSLGSMQARRSHSYSTSTGRLQATWEWHDPLSSGVGVAGSDYLIEYDYTDAGRVEYSGTSSERTTFAYGLDGLLELEGWDDQERVLSYGDTWTDSDGIDWRSTLLTTSYTERIAGPGTSGLRSVDFFYDSAGRVVEQQTVEGAGGTGVSLTDTVVHTWSDLDAYGNALTTEVQRASPLLTSGGNWSDWTYDEMGRVLTRDTLTTVGSSSYPAATIWSWYGDGNLASVYTPDHNLVGYTRGLSADLEHELLSVEFNGATWATITSRDAELRITDLSTIDGYFHSLSYDNMGRLASRTLSGATAAAWTGSYNDEGELVQETVTDHSGSSWLNTYSYTPEGWLESEARGGSGEFREYVYDSDGRRTETKVNGILSRVTSWTGSKVGSVDGVPVSYDDFDGVETDHLAYDYERDASGRVSAIYDGSSGHALYETMRDELGRIVSLDESSSGERRTTWGLGIGGLPLEVQDSSGATVNYLAVEGLLVGAMRTTSGATAQHVALMTDGMGSIVQAGTEVTEPGTAFGESPGPNSADLRFVFAGLEALLDAPGIQMSQQRVYDEETGRFLSPDPIGQGGGWHRTRYGAGSPTKYRDPTGYSIESYGSHASDGTMMTFPDAGAELFGNDVYAPQGLQDSLDGGVLLDIDGSSPGWVYNEGYYKLQAHMGFMNWFSAQSAETKANRKQKKEMGGTGSIGEMTNLQFRDRDDDGWIRRSLNRVSKYLSDYGKGRREARKPAQDSEPDPVMNNGVMVINERRTLRDRVRGFRRRVGDFLNSDDLESYGSIEGGLIAIGGEIMRRIDDQVNTTMNIYGNVPGAIEELADASFPGKLSKGEFQDAALMPLQVLGGVVMGPIEVVDSVHKGIINAPLDLQGLGSGNQALMEEGAVGVVDTGKSVVELAMMVEGVRTLGPGKGKIPGKPCAKCLVRSTPVFTSAGLISIASISTGDVVLTVPDPSVQPAQPATPYALFQKVLVTAVDILGEQTEHHFEAEDLVLLSDGQLQRAAALQPEDEIFGLQGSLSVQAVRPYTESLTERKPILEVAR